MSLLRFDATGSISAEFGITQSQIDSLSGPLIELRDQFEQFDETNFFRRPENQHAAYLADREASELGKIFTVANGLHDHFDAVVVLGSDEVTIGARAMRDACCDPYHNELTRAARGSKPRMYFGGDRFDNDATASLIHRMTEGGYGDSLAETRWAIIAMDPSGNNPATTVAFERFRMALKDSLGADVRNWLPRLVIPVTAAEGELARQADEMGCEVVFTDPQEVFGHVLSPFGLLPAAMLGLDCIKLLEGAVAMNEHFNSADYAENVVLQSIAVGELMAQHRGNPVRVLQPCTRTLASAQRWHDQLRKTNHLDGQHHGKMINHIAVDHDRHDPVAVGNQTIPGLAESAQHVTNVRLAAQQCPTTTTHFPTIDTYVLGQWFQMSMIAAVLDAKLKTLS
ncbi:glucose-6-phosphate isomerase [Rubripirellula reticaptiva]|uniref:Glucose-6-phosphate isomerase B n=1 Tax=Rubripirellula reticaptiva TaxID=2528013 RepID=A0A5C6FAJ4_9BACT|nr:glucose-6-phosphate isomerase [Rubripirellula reticaptiva]TWU57550.1 Glucose-6-phosphate isomerase B [Rubripirellula reticaptiva]